MKPKFQKKTKSKKPINLAVKDQYTVMFSQGLALHKAGQFDQAKKIYEVILQTNPKHFDSIQLLGAIALQTGEYERAIDLLSAALQIEANNFSVLTNLGNALKGLGRFEEAITCYDKVLFIKKDFQDAYLNRGIALHQLFKYEDAVVMFNEAIKINTSFAEAYYSLGLSLKELKRFDEAITSLDRAILINPNIYHSYNIKGIVLQELSQFESALISFDQAIKIKSDFFEAYSNRGNVLRQLSRLDEALISYELAIKINPNYSAVYSNRGTVLRELARYELALENFELAIKIDPNNAEAYFNQGLVLHELKKTDAALESLVKAINLSPKNSNAYTAVGSVLHDMGQFNEALKSYELAIYMNPESHVAFASQALTLHELKKFEAALQSYEKSISLKSDSPEVYFNRGNTYQKLSQLSLAIESFEKAINLKADYAAPYLNRSIALYELGRFEGALDSCSKALLLDPNLEYAYGLMLFQKMKICDWSNLQQKLSFLETEASKLKKVSTPFDSLVFFDNPLLNFVIGNMYVQVKFQKKHPVDEIPNRQNDGRLRIGFYSADLYYHPVSIWLAEQLENHDKSKFELFAFSFKEVIDPMRSRLVSAFDHWIDVRYMTDMEVVHLSRDLKIDIAIDLNGHTTDSRPNIFMHRASPIQVSSIGYPGSSCTDFIDYFLTEPHSVTKENRQFFTEKIAYVPSNYTYDRQRQISNEPIYRSDYGLPENSFVFTCQNGSQKFNPEVFGIWMEILNAVPSSVLWLLKPNDMAINNLKKEARERGIDDKRLIFTGRELVPVQQERHRISRYLASYKLADLFLDTWPYNAGTTGIDALWAGTPVLTKAGNAVSARMCYSALKQIELPELITYTPIEYRDLAISLATDPDRIKLIKVKLEKNRLSTALFDPVGNTRHIENAYLEMYRRYSEGLPPSDIYYST